jgi:hypothetical protein
MSKVTIEIDSRWVKIARSPLFFIVSALQGVSVTFAPYFLYLSAKGQFVLAPERVVVPLCFVVIFLVPLSYFRLGSVVIKELRQKEIPPSPVTAPR